MNRIRIFFIFAVLVFFSVMPVFSSTGGSAPKLEFTKWQAGQGQEYTASNPLHTFITDTETTCEITATVAYASSQPSSVYPLTGYTWQVTGSHGYTFTTQTEASGPVGQTGTTFKLTATGTGDEHNASSGGHRPMRGRSEKPITFTVKFIGEYGTDPNNQQELSISVDFEQDEKDQMRQEYLDVRRLHKENRSSATNTYGNLRIPSRGELGKSGERFNDGHYSYLINKSLETKILHWWQACDKVAYEELDNDDLTNDKGNKALRLSGGYRNPHHHVYHVYADEKASEIKYWSLHQFGLALDVGSMDMDGKNGITTAIDRYEMAETAKDHAGASWTKHNYSDGHVHAQWGAVRNAPGGNSKESKRVPKKKEEDKKHVKILPCGHVDDGGWQHFPKYYPTCGHADYYCLRAHGQKSCPYNAKDEECIVDGGWMHKCNEHTHKYPSDVVVAPEPKTQVTPTTTDPKPKQVTPTTTDPKPKQVLPKDSDDDDSDDDDGGTTRVDPQVTSPCGHTHKKSLASSHAEVN